MSNVLDKITNELATFNEKKKALTEELRKEFPALFAPIFADSKRIESFAWTQYTPYFNDGDECVFGVRQDDLEINGEDEYDAEWRDWRAKYPQYHEELKAAGEVDFAEMALIEQIQNVLHTVPDDFYKELFGDHVKVIVHKSGEIEVEEYEHD